MSFTGPITEERVWSLKLTRAAKLNTPNLTHRPGGYPPLRIVRGYRVFPLNEGKDEVALM